MNYPQIDPIALQLGPISIHWYGLMYAVAFLSAWILGHWRAKAPHSPVTPEQITDMVFYGAVGAIAGGRLGYMLFYDWSTLIHHPLTLFAVWQGGMSFHGGMIGVFIAMWLYSRRLQQPFLAMTDFIAPLVPIGLGAGRIGNFINTELWGRPTDLPWGLIFPHVDAQTRHPSVIYEFLLEGVLLFIILWFFSSKPRPRMAVSGLFMLCYGSFRCLVEFVREPDSHLGFIALDWLTMGQLLSVPMIATGIVLLILAYKPKTVTEQ